LKEAGDDTGDDYIGGSIFFLISSLLLYTPEKKDIFQYHFVRFYIFNRAD